MHSEDAVVALLLLSLASCTPKAPSPSKSLVRGPSGARAGARRDAAASAAEAAEEEEEEALDRAAADAGLSSFALPCDADSECLTHRCDARVGHCRFPCQSDDDCDPKAYCDVEGGALAACFRR